MYVREHHDGVVMRPGLIWLSTDRLSLARMEIDQNDTCAYAHAYINTHAHTNHIYTFTHTNTREHTNTFIPTTE